MTGLEGNRLSICPLRFRIASQEFLLTSAAPRSIETLGEAILNLKGQINSLLPEGPVIICFIIPLCFSKEKNYYFNWKLISATMGLVTKNHICLNDHNDLICTLKSVILDDIAISGLVSVSVVIPVNSWRTIDWSIVGGLLTGLHHFSQ